MDTIGAGLYTPKFAVSATCAESLLGTCEALFVFMSFLMNSYKENMEPEELFEVISQCLLSSVDRDAYSGWGAEVYIITPDQIIQRRLKARMDYRCLLLFLFFFYYNDLFFLFFTMICSFYFLQ